MRKPWIVAMGGQENDGQSGAGHGGKGSDEGQDSGHSDNAPKK
ncbi:MULTISPECIES: hypothetical protein [Streptomyces]|nr:MULTISPECIES: hypothetical protein [Streptomyces]